jgi:hypothetical protein
MASSSFTNWKSELENGDEKVVRESLNKFIVDNEMKEVVPDELQAPIINLILEVKSQQQEEPIQFVPDETLSVDHLEQELLKDTQSLENKEEVRAVIRKICFTRSSPYKSDLTVLASTLAPVYKNSSDLKTNLYYALNALLDQFAPFLLRGGSLELNCFSKLFRLILQYHDPELSLHFDKNRRDPDEYFTPWLNSLFAKQFSQSKIIDLWILLLTHEDPVLVSLFGMALIIAHRDKFLEVNQPELNSETIRTILSTIPESQDESTYIHSLYTKTKTLRDATPLSARNQLNSVIFPTGVSNLQVLNDTLAESVVLPIPTSEIVEAFKRKQSTHRSTPVRYIIIDCRSLKSFRFARLPTAIHIGEHVGYDKQKMQAIMDRFDAAKGSHFTIFGTGRQIREEDNLLKVIAMRFLGQGFEHISVATGGFKDTIKYITADEIEYVRDENLQSDRSTQNKEEWTAEVISTKISSIFSWGKKVAEDYIAENEKQQHSTGTSASATSSSNKTSSTQAKKSGQILKSPEPPKSAFTLEDEDFDIDDYHLNEEDDREKIVKLEDLKKLDEFVNIFPATLEATKRSDQEASNSPVDDQLAEKRYIAVGRNFILSIKPHPTMLGYGIISWKRTLRQLLKLSFAKDDSTKITFTVKGYPGTLSYNVKASTSSPTFQELYTMSQSMECIKVIQQNMSLLKKQRNHQLASNSD